MKVVHKFFSIAMAKRIESAQSPIFNICIDQKNNFPLTDSGTWSAINKFIYGLYKYYIMSDSWKALSVNVVLCLMVSEYRVPQ